MISLEKRQLLKTINAKLLNQVLVVENQAEEVRTVQLLNAKNNEKTLKINYENREVFFHSKYNPQKEAETFAQQYLDLSEYKHVFFIGTGLGYHIDLILEANPQIKYSIFEPNEEIMFHYLNRDNAQIFKPSKVVSIFSNLTQLHDLEGFLNNYIDGTITIFWNATKQVYQEEIEVVQSELVKRIKNKRDNIVTNFRFQQHWTINAIQNLPKVLNTSNILLDVNKNTFLDKPILLVAAGPSLSYEWEYLKIIKEKRLAYIFAVGSAINGLIEKNILPDAFFTYDPSHLNKTVVAKLKELEIDNVPVVFGSTVASDTLTDLKTPLLHFITSQDNLTATILKKRLPVILDSPSISVMTYQIIAALKASHIIIVGQNLGYVDNRVYANEIKYDHVSEELTENQVANLLEVDDVEGNKIKTNESFESMRKALEVFINANKHSVTINTTKKGVNIMGAPYMPLEQVVEELLTVENIVEKEWYQCSNSYDLQIAESQKELLLKEATKLEKTLKMAMEEISKINNLYNKKIMSNLDNALTRFDKSLMKIRDNAFFNNVIVPTIQNQNVIMSKRSAEVKLENNPILKVKLFNEIFVKYIEAAYASYLIMMPYFNKLKEGVLEEKSKL